MFILDACDNVNVLSTFYFIKELLKCIFLLIPIALVVTITIDFVKNFISKDNNSMKANLKKAIKRIIYAVVIFLVPSIVEFVMGVFIESDVKYVKCLYVDLDTIKSQITINMNECNRMIAKGEALKWDSASKECLLVPASSKKDIGFDTGTLIRNTSVDFSDGASSGNASLDGAIAWAIKTANDNSIGYSQARRQLNPDVDCSSFVYYSLVRGGGFSTKVLGSGPFRTSSMTGILSRAGFEKYSVSGKKISDLKPGDILWRRGHTELYIGNGKRAGAHGCHGKGRSCKGGDQNGKEVSVTKISKFGKFTHYFRYKG